MRDISKKYSSIPVGTIHEAAVVGARVNTTIELLCLRENMEIASYLVKAAENHLATEDATKLPAQLANTDFCLTFIDDTSVVAHGSIRHAVVEYRIGIKRK